jgi:hypothetical protein
VAQLDGSASAFAFMVSTVGLERIASLALVIAVGDGVLRALKIKKTEIAAMITVKAPMTSRGGTRLSLNLKSSAAAVQF